jgi:hypothetical protein
VDHLDEQLQRWLAAGVITPEQAQTIRLLERRPPGGEAAPGRRSVAAEVLGYLGGALAIGAAGVLGSGSWAHLDPGARVGVLAAVAAALVAAGWWLRRLPSRPLARLASVLWLLSVAGAGSALTVWAQGSGDLGELGGSQLAALATTAYAGTLWLLERRSLQQVALFAGIATSVYEVGEHSLHLTDLQVALAYATLGAAWLALGWKGWVRPLRTALTLSTLALATAPLWGLDAHDWLLPGGVAVAAGLVVAGVAVRQGDLLGIGIAALLLYVATTIASYLHGAGAPLALLGTGIVLVVLAVAIARKRRAPVATPPAD